MKKYYSKIILIFFVIVNSNYYAQWVAPLKLGNSWIYDNITYIERKTVADTNFIVDTISYKKVRTESHSGIEYYNYERLREDGYYVVRLDTSYPAPNHELLYYKKNAVIGDTWINPGEEFDIIYTIVDTAVYTIFGEAITVKRMDIDATLLYFKEYWTEKFGVLSRNQHPFPNMYELKSCVIDGVAYGDTSFPVIVTDDITYFKAFSLDQNYPNPFNPTSTISYKIPLSEKVKLSVYNSIGEVISVLVDEWQESGEYKVEFNGENFPSGVYFYLLEYNNGRQTKKMVLLR